MLTLLALQTTKALLIAMKKAYRLPQGRLLDNAVEEYAIKLLGVRKVRQIQKAMLDPVKREQLTREPRADGEADGATQNTSASAAKIAIVRSAMEDGKADGKVKRIRSTATPRGGKRVSFLQEPEGAEGEI
jgi:hypothetical protein